MKELWYGKKHYDQRNEIYDWCEQNFGPYGPDSNGNKRWIFYCDGEAEFPNWQIDTRLHIYLNDADAIWFKLKWE